MDITFPAFAMPSEGAIVVGVLEERVLTASAKRLDETTGGAITRAVADGRFTGKENSTLPIVAPNGLKASVLLLAGLGAPADLDRLRLSNTGGAIVAALNRLGVKQAAVMVDAVDGSEHSPAAMAADLALGARLKSYRFDKYRTTQKAEEKPTLASLAVMTDAPGEAEAAFVPRGSLADGVFLTRDLVSEPSNNKYPQTVVDRVNELAAIGIDVEILNREKMQSLNMGALLGVSLGSEREPFIAVMRWNGAPDGADQQPIAFVGKGVTFDTGGISIKPSQGMEEMKYDMAGAGTVVGLMKALAGRKARANVVGVVGLVENMPDGKAQRPGDVVTTMSGQTIEVINTDAEGRLVLADALWYTQATYKPKFMINLATLTGAIVVGLGTYQAGLFSNDDKLSAQLIAAGKAEAEEVWRMPLGERYDKDINSEIADMKNVGKGREAGSVTAAQLLLRFVNGVPWAHLDIAGMAWMKRDDDPLTPKGASAYGVRLLNRLVADNFEA
jgi:leucyl aminopeptidase